MSVCGPAAVSHGELVIYCYSGRRTIVGGVTSYVTVKPIRILGDPVLHRVTGQIPVNTDGSLPLYVGALITDLFDTLAASKGVGLAANQIGTSLRVFVYDCPEVRGEAPRRRGVIVNPWLERSEVSQRAPVIDTDREGCLSVPGEVFPIRRANWARVSGLDADNSPVSVEGTEVFARMLQHETDHLDGLLYVDRLTQPYRQHAAAAVDARGWGSPGLSWNPGTDPHPFDGNR